MKSIKNSWLGLFPLFACLLLSERAIGKTFFLDGSDAIFASVGEIHVDIIDEVEGKCFLNAYDVKTSVELTLRKAGIKIASKTIDPNGPLSFLTDRLKIKVIGYRVTNLNSCIAFSIVELEMYRAVQVPFTEDKKELLPINFRFFGELMSGPSDLSARIKESAVSGAERFANQILKSREDLKANYPAEYEKIKAGRKFP